MAIYLLALPFLIACGNHIYSDTTNTYNYCNLHKVLFLRSFVVLSGVYQNYRQSREAIATEFALEVEHAQDPEQDPDQDPDQDQDHNHNRDHDRDHDRDSA